MLALCGKDSDGTQQPCAFQTTQLSSPSNYYQGKHNLIDTAIKGMVLSSCTPRTNTICVYTLHHKILKYKLMVDMIRIKGYECV